MFKKFCSNNNIYETYSKGFDFANGKCIKENNKKYDNDDFLNVKIISLLMKIIELYI